MMDYKEMAAIVRERGDAILAKRAARSRLIKRISFSVSGIAVSAAAALCIWNNKDISNVPEREPVSSNIIADTTTNGTSPTADTTTVTAVTTTKRSAQNTKTETITTTAAKKGNEAAATTVSSTSKNGSTSISSVSVSPKRTDTTAISSAETIVTTTITISDNKEVVRMKVEKIKKYLAALSAAAITASPMQGVSAEDNIYTPKPVSVELEYYLKIQNEPEKYDFNGNGKFDPMDSYALFTFINDNESLPDGFFERCIANGDINSDGVFTESDFSLLFDMCLYNFFDEEFANYNEGQRNGKIKIDKVTSEDQFYELYACNKRYLSPDCTPEEKEKYLCWFVHESYTYGSEKNRDDYLIHLYNTAFNGFSSFTDRVKDLEYYYFTKETEEKSITFDINGDGTVDMKDAYDVYLYNSCLPYDDVRRARFYYDVFNINKENLPIAQLIDLSSEDLEVISKYCEPLFDTAAKYLVCDNEAMELVLRHIMSESDLSYDKLLSIYYASYRQVTVNDEPIEHMFLLDAKEVLNRYFDSSIEQFDEGKCEKLIKSEEIDEKYLNDNEAFRELLNKVKEDFYSGKTEKLFDVNGDGKVDRYDGYIADQFLKEMFRGTPCKYSVVPEKMWNYLDKEFDIDNDGLAGDLIDLEMLTFIAEEIDRKVLTDYEQDLYFLELIEQKGLKNTEEIEPFMSQLCSNKGTGDVNLDGKVTAVDASAVLTYYAESSVNAETNCVTEAKMKYLADFNSDNIVDNRDASLILSEYAQSSVD